MGASESTLSYAANSQPIDEITTVSERREGVDPLLQRFNTLKIATPILTSPSSNPTQGSLTDILLKKQRSSSSFPATQGTLDAKVILELFSMYRNWQEEKAKRIGQRQEEIENKIEVADALAVKLLQRFNHSASAMRTSSHHLSEVEALEVEVGELKGRLTEVISNCDAVCKRIASHGPESLRSSVKSFSDSIPSIQGTEQTSSSSSSSIINRSP
ncbi:hypothetical protein ACHQM5_024706 [Ranunculus cassubicifolius]